MLLRQVLGALTLAIACVLSGAQSRAADRITPAAAGTLTPLPGAPARAARVSMPRGPAPVGLWVQTETPVAHRLIWSLPYDGQGNLIQGIAGYRIYSAPQVNGQWTLRTPAGFAGDFMPNPSQRSWLDASLVAPGQVYRVTALYVDGREGSADYVYTNPLQPETPTGFTVRQTGPGAVSLSWQPVKYASFLLFGSGQPVTGSPINGTQASFSNLPDGTYTWMLSADYGGVHGPGPSVSITLNSTGRYRVVANGLRLLNNTNDLANALTGDGEGDEVYAGFAMFHVGRPQGQLLDQDLRNTVVHGDAGRIPNRVKAGTASLQGGLQNGDVFPPVQDPSQRFGAPVSTLTFPFVVWDGMLTYGKDAMVIFPTLWESDPVKIGDNTASYTNWFLGLKSGLTKIWSDLMVQQALQNKTIALTTPPLWAYFPATGPVERSDHPIGSIYDQSVITGAPFPLPGAGGGGMGKKFPHRLLVLTREVIEAALANSNGIVAVPLLDQGAQGIVGNGSYVLYLQVERVP